MKRIMSIAVAAAMAGGAYAQIAATTAPVNVFDFQAVVKNVNQKVGRNGAQINVNGVMTYPRYIQYTALYGYLVTECAPCLEGDCPRTMLVVANRADAKPATVYAIPSSFKQVRAFKSGNLSLRNKSWDAEGGLWIGFDTYWPNPGVAPDPNLLPPQAVNPVWSSYFEGLQAVEIGLSTYTENLFLGLNYADRTQGTFAFANVWMHAAGFGKATVDVTTINGKPCEYGGGQTSCTILESLCGSIIGGLFLCYEENNTSIEMMLCNDQDITTTRLVGQGPGTTDWIAGSWAIKRNISGFTNVSGTFCDYVIAAGRKINSSFTYDCLDLAVCDEQTTP